MSKTGLSDLHPVEGDFIMAFLDPETFGVAVQNLKGLDFKPRREFLVEDVSEGPIGGARNASFDQSMA